MFIETEQPKEVRETRENKEASLELKAAAAMERAELLVKEVKQSKQQMQNIIINMQLVVQTIRQLRAKLQLVTNDDDPASVKQDKEQIERLKKKIIEYGTELENMRGDLVREQMDELKHGVGAGLSSEELQKKAEEMVEEMIKVIKE